MNNEYGELIDQWFYDRNLNTAEPAKQMLKLMEEAGELAEGIAKGNTELTKDGIGDVYVVLRGLCIQLDIDFNDCVGMAYNEIKDRKGMLVEGVFVKEEDLGKMNIVDEDRMDIE